MKSQMISRNESLEKFKTKHITKKMLMDNINTRIFIEDYIIYGSKDG